MTTVVPAAPARVPADVQLAPTGIAAALVGAAAIHATVAPEHVVEWLAAGTFFVVLELVEVALALAALRAWRRPVAVAVVLSGTLTVLIWAVSRSTGLPLGPDGFRNPAAAGAADIACCILEVIAALLALPSALPSAQGPGRRPWRAPGRARPRLARVAVVAICLTVTAWGLSPAWADRGQTGADPPGHAHAHAAGIAGGPPA